MSRISSDSSLFGFDSDDWLERLRRSERTESLGSLGPYELIAEAGRGGQGVVYRARQPTTGRAIAVKRLLAGTLASPESLRRFEREIQAASALNHPGIVAVYGVDFAAGMPLLAMEWVEGVPVTQWALGRPRAEVLACFLSICDAVQHAHQRGVLHRDVKPSNVLVDAAGRARLLDFGLARLFQADSSITTSGIFAGTPAYAAPEQFDGSDLDVRSDVYSLGAILFEMLTGRRLFEGDGVEALVRAPRPLAPPRPSSLVRSIPRDLDAIVLQALAHGRTERYQSVDALSGDLRRFLAGEPVMAHGPSTWYQIQRLVARNRAISASLAALLLANLVYLGVLVRQSRRLSDERDRALLAGEAEKEARAEAQHEATVAREAKEDAQRQRSRADEKAASLEDVLDFFLDDVVNAASPRVSGPEVRLVDAMRSATTKVEERFAGDPLVASRVHSMLGEALYRIGSLPEAETEVRLALELLQGQVDASVGELAEVETLLGTILEAELEYPEAERWFRQAVAHREADPTTDRVRLRVTLNGHAGVLLKLGRLEESLEVQERVSDLSETEEDHLCDLNSRSVVLFQMGKTKEALDLLESAARAGLTPDSQASVLFNLGIMHEAVGNMERAEQCFVEAAALAEQSQGKDHPDVAHALTGVGRRLVGRGDYAGARACSERAEKIARQVYPGSSEHAHALLVQGQALQGLGLPGEALALLEEATRIFRAVKGLGLDWENAAVSLVEVLLEHERAEEAEALLADLGPYWHARPGDPANPRRFAWLALRRAWVSALRGENERAVELFEESIQGYSAAGKKESAANAMLEFARFLRSAGDLEGAAALELEAAETPE